MRKHEQDSVWELLAHIKNSARLSRLGDDSEFDAQSIECGGWLFSLMTGNGLVELHYDSPGLESLQRYTSLIFMMSGVVSSGASPDVPVVKLGQLILFRSPQHYELRFAGNFRYLVVVIETSELTDFGACAIQENKAVSAYSGSGAVLGGALRGLCSSLFLEDKCAYLEEIKPALRNLIRATFKPVAPESRKVINTADPADIVIDWIERNIDRPSIKIGEAASAVGVSVRTLQRAFTKRHTSFQSTLVKTRMAIAAERLTDPSKARLSVGEIAASCGISVPSQFAAAFRKTFGMSASEFRRSHSRNDSQRH
ncbi:helix-turn-helix transcriptional regulator [Haliea sp.]